MKNKIKIAFLILAHTNLEQLNIFINQLLKYDNSYIFIHIDKKSNIKVEAIEKNKRIIILNEKISVEWGDYSIIEAQKLLITKSFNYGKFDYFSFHSGSDLLVRPIEELVEYLMTNEYDAYMDVKELNPQNEFDRRIYSRIYYRYPRFLKKRCTKFNPLRYIRAIYMRTHRLRKNRNKEDYKYFYGSNWITMSNKAVNKMLNFIDKNPKYNERFINSFCGDEIYFNSIIMNVDGLKIKNEDNLRYIDWTYQDKWVGSPKILKIDDYQRIINSKKYIARKFDINVDNLIIEQIK